MHNDPARTLQPEDIPPEDQHPDLAHLPEGLKPTPEGEKNRKELIEALQNRDVTLVIIKVKNLMTDANYKSDDFYYQYAGLQRPEDFRDNDHSPKAEWVRQYHSLKKIHELLEKARKDKQTKNETDYKKEAKAEKALKFKEPDAEERIKAARESIDTRVTSITSNLSEALRLLRTIPPQYLTYQRWESYPW